MDASIKAIFEGQEFQSLPQVKQQYLREMIETMEGRSLQERVQILLSYGFRMQNEGQALTRQESDMLMQVLQQNLSPEEKDRVSKLMQML